MVSPPELSSTQELEENKNKDEEKNVVYLKKKCKKQCMNPLIWQILFTLEFLLMIIMLIVYLVHWNNLNK